MPRRATPKSIMMHVEGALDVDFITLCEKGTKIEKLSYNPMETSTVGIRCSIGSSEQWLTQTWTMNLTLSMSTRLALGRASTCVLSWTSRGRGESIRPRTGPLSEQRLRKSACHKCRPRLLKYPRPCLGGSFKDPVSLSDQHFHNDPPKELLDVDDSLIRRKDGSGRPRPNLHDVNKHNQSRCIDPV